MKVTLKEAIVKYNILTAISGKKLPVRLGYAVSRNLAKLQAECGLIEKERIKLLENYAQKDAGGKPIINDSEYELGENKEAYTREYMEYLDTEIEISIHQVSESEMDKLEEARYDALTPEELGGLEFIFEICENA